MKRVPTVYFIDDSATMREVIKIAFRRENINVITCADAASALAQFEQNRPDVVITDVIMPDQDGYSVCSQIKQNPELGGIPVVLMSGVVNKSVADKAVAVKADELIRKPFQPQELIGRVKTLLAPKMCRPPRRGSGVARARCRVYSRRPCAPWRPRHSCAGPYQWRRMRRQSRQLGRARLRKHLRRCCRHFHRMRHNSLPITARSTDCRRHHNRRHLNRLTHQLTIRLLHLRRKSRNCAARLRAWNCWLESCRASCSSNANTMWRSNNKFAH